jgi:hypothetical protein
MQAQAAACNFCGVPLTQDQVLYTADARVACQQCNAKVDLVVTDMRVGHGIRNAAIYGLVSACVSFLFNPLFLVTISSMISSIYAVTSVNRRGDERFTQHIQKDKGMILACSIIGIVLNAIIIILIFIALSSMGSQTTTYEYEYR